MSELKKLFKILNEKIIKLQSEKEKYLEKIEELEQKLK
jgi:hypothetical protein